MFMRRILCHSRRPEGGLLLFLRRKKVSTFEREGGRTASHLGGVLFGEVSPDLTL